MSTPSTDTLRGDATQIKLRNPIKTIKTSSVSHLHENSTVIVRTKPSGLHAVNNLLISPERNQIEVYIPKSSGHHVNNQQERWNFQFDKVFHNVSQDVVFDDSCKDLVANALDGYNSTILTYGQIGSGKTFTMMGSNTIYKQRGIAPRAINHLFEYIKVRSDMNYQVMVSYIEVYNDTIRDLLHPNLQTLSEQQICEDENGLVSIKKLTQIPVQSEEQALACLFKGESVRTVGKHELNSKSSRSHVIVTFYISSHSRIESTERHNYSKLSFVDLAGLERIGKTSTTGTTLIEAKYNNTSLSFLEQVIVSLGQTNLVTATSANPGEGTFIETLSNLDHIPFRRSKLTNLLRDCIGVHCKTCLIATVCLEKEYLEETLSTLRFASQMSKVQSNVAKVEGIDTKAYINILERQIQSLQSEISLYTSLYGKDANTSSSSSSSSSSLSSTTNQNNNTLTNGKSILQQQDISKNIRLYVDGVLPTLPITSITNIQETFHQFKLLVKNLQNQLQKANANANANTNTNTTSMDTHNGNTTTNTSNNSNLTGMELNLAGISSTNDTSMHESVRDSGSTNTKPGSASSRMTNKTGKSITNSRRATLAKVSMSSDQQQHQGQGQGHTDSTKSKPIEVGNVGTVVNQNGVSIGTAPSQTSKLVNSGANVLGYTYNTNTGVARGTTSRITVIDGTHEKSPLHGLVTGNTMILPTNITSVPSKDTAFEWFRNSHPKGIPLNKNFTTCKTNYMNTKQNLLDITNKLNVLSSEIEGLNKQLSQKTNQTTEYALMKTLRIKKELVSELSDVRINIVDQLEQTRQQVEEAKQNLAKAFLSYYTTTYNLDGGHTDGTTTTSTTGGSMYDEDVLTSYTNTSMSDVSRANTSTKYANKDIGEQFDALATQKVTEQDSSAMAFYLAKKMVFDNKAK